MLTLLTKLTSVQYKHMSLLRWLYLLRGSSWTTAKHFCSMEGINPYFYFVHNSDDFAFIQHVIVDRQNKYLLQKNLIKKKFNFYIHINHYKGKRLLRSLPLNGQRTHTNAKTQKKNKFLLN